MHRSQRFLIGNTIFLGEQRPGKWPWILVFAVSSERSTDSWLPPPEHSLVSKVVHLGVVSSAPGRTSVSSSLSVPRSHLPTSHPERLPVAFPSQAPPPHQWWSVSSLMLSSAGNQNTMCVNIKSCHLFMLQTSGRKKENHSSLFIKKKKKIGTMLKPWWPEISLLLTARKCLTPEVFTAIINCEYCKNGNKK